MRPLKIAMVIIMSDYTQNGLLIARELETQGHVVQRVSLHTPHRQLVEQVVSFRPDVVFGTHTHRYLPASLMGELKERTPALMVLWYVDAYALFLDKEVQRFEQSRGIYDLMLIGVKGIAEGLSKKGLSSTVKWTPQYYDPVCYGDPYTVERTDKYDLCFIGNEHEWAPERRSFIETLQARYKMLVAGRGWGRGIALGKDSSQFYLNAKMSFDTPKKIPSMSCGFSVRTFNCLANGCLFLMPPVPNIEAIFQPGKHLVVYDGTLKDLCTKVDYYLEHDDERKAISRAGRMEVLSEHTIAIRVQQYLKYIEEALLSHEYFSS